MTTLTDLPADILYIIFPYLTASEFLRLTSSTKALTSYRQDPTFWRTLTRTTFRIPPQPLLQADGARWQWLYKNLATQTQLFTWGNDDKGSLGHTAETKLERLQIATGRRPQRPLRSLGKRSGWPRRVKIEDIDEDVGVVADVQCGGWSTTLLNSIGVIYAFGVFNGLIFMEARGEDLRRLSFPPAYPPTTTERYEPSTAISQYSTGRSHVLGLADDGKIWMWTKETAFLIKPLHVNVGGRSVKKVVAGWDRSSIYVADTGIIYWDSSLSVNSEEDATDGLLVETVTIPGTGYRREHHSRTNSTTLESRIGAVTNHIVLEGYILFTTDINKLFCYPTTFPMPALDQPEPFELTTFYPSDSSPFEIRDLQGSYRNFVLFTKSGSVLTASRDLLDAFYAASSSPETPSAPLPEPNRLPGLQGKSIISLAFGDYHYHALHANGKITSHGVDSQACGALGLGHRGLAQLRGVRYDPFSGNGSLVHEAGGRTIWFEPLMERMLQDMSTKSMEGEARARGQMLNDPATSKAIGDYFEREGSHWEDDVTSEGGMGAYFALKVSAAGWHSAALVLVDEEKAEQARQSHILHPHEPTPAPTPGPASVAGSEDHWGGTWEDIDSPWEQLSKTFFGVVDFVWWLGRWFLGLTARDAIARESQEGGVPGGAAGLAEALAKRAEVRYVWSEKPFPRLRLGNGAVMPGEVEVVE